MSHLEALLARTDAPTLAEGAACLAADEDGETSPDACLAAVDEVARGLYLPPGEAVTVHVARLVQHLFVNLGFEGDRETYDDPDNSLIHKVIARRAGLPILLSVLTISVASRRGLSLEPVGFPGHFLVGVPGETRFFLDPFERGQVHTAEALEVRLAAMGVPAHRAAQAMAPSPPLAVLLRMCGNLRGAYLRRGQAADARRMESRMVLLQERL